MGCEYHCSCLLKKSCCCYFCRGRKCGNNPLAITGHSVTEDIQKYSLFCLYSLPPVIPTQSKANCATPSTAVPKLIRILFNKFLITSKSSGSDSLVTTSVTSVFFFSSCLCALLQQEIHFHSNPMTWSMSIFLILFILPWNLTQFLS